ncbi:YbaB/EbfC family nucleoid-associated protein [Streptomyces sp. URMC 126]|uniref:YbaB/EbfC family nucleoid-associated protein n=1 Tax=Streptomyces sp. URMC 126 TaxID=3423401 RepID=UPI003F194F2B
MNGDPFADLHQVRDHIQGIQRLMSDMRERVPREVTGSDPQGAVTVRLAADGLPERVALVTDWQRRQAPAALSAAVTAAYESALRERLEDWSRSLEETGWERRAEQLDATSPFTAASPHTADTSGTSGTSSTAPPSAAPTAAAPELPELDLRYVLPRRLDEVTEELLSLFDLDGIAGSDAAEPETFTGKSAGGQVTVTVAQGSLVSCSVDPAWADGRSAVRLNQALAEALSDARDRLVAGSSRGPSALQLDGLFKEAMAILGDPARFAD